MLTFRRKADGSVPLMQFQASVVGVHCSLPSFLERFYCLGSRISLSFATTSGSAS